MSTKVKHAKPPSLEEIVRQRKPVRDINAEHEKRLSRMDRLGLLITERVGTMGFFSGDFRLDGPLAGLEPACTQKPPIRSADGVYRVAVHLQSDPDFPDAVDHGAAKRSGPACGDEGGERLSGQSQSRAGDRGDPPARGVSEYNFVGFG